MPIPDNAVTFGLGRYVEQLSIKDVLSRVSMTNFVVSPTAARPAEFGRPSSVHRPNNAHRFVSAECAFACCSRTSHVCLHAVSLRARPYTKSAATVGTAWIREERREKGNDNLPWRAARGRYSCRRRVSPCVYTHARIQTR